MRRSTMGRSGRESEKLNDGQSECLPIPNQSGFILRTLVDLLFHA